MAIRPVEVPEPEGPAIQAVRAQHPVHLAQFPTQGIGQAGAMHGPFIPPRLCLPLPRGPLRLMAPGQGLFAILDSGLQPGIEEDPALAGDGQVGNRMGGIGKKAQIPVPVRPGRGGAFAASEIGKAEIDPPRSRSRSRS